jgi:very-short-patch-repair endonuclease
MPSDRINKGEVLVAILNEPRDFHIASEHGWYRVPVDSAHKRLKGRWPPQWLAFYQTKIFADEAYSIRYYAEVLGLRNATRRELFPSEPEGVKSNRVYHQLMLGPLQRLRVPIFSRRWRRIIFIPTTWAKFTGAAEINDLYDESPLEDKLWAALKTRRIPAERQEYLTVSGRDYVLDFAVYCARGPLDIETDGDTYHANPDKAADDNERNNHLTAAGWRILRFNTQQINESAETYCIEAVAQTINDLGGVDDGFVPRNVDSQPNHPYQPGLFDDW